MKTSVLAFIGGAAAAGAAAGISKTSAFRNALVQVTARGIIVKDTVNGAVQTVKDQAEDVAADAREEAKKISAEAEKKAEIERRVREEVEKELAKETKPAKKATK